MSRLDDRLPTRDQIKAISDIGALERLREAVDLDISRIETDLEFRTDDEEWAKRARGALARHRVTMRTLNWRIGVLKAKAVAETVSESRRGPDECSPHTIAVLKEWPQIQVALLSTVGEVDDMTAWLVERLEALSQDRDDEIGLPAGERDESFLSATKKALTHLNRLRQALQNRRGEISRAAKKAATTTDQETRERLFIEAAREILDRDIYVSIWDRVDRRAQAVAA